MNSRGSFVFAVCLIATIAIAAMLIFWQLGERRRHRWNPDSRLVAAQTLRSPSGPREGPADAREAFRRLAPKLSLTAEQLAAIEATIEKSRQEGRQNWEVMREAQEHLTPEQRLTLQDLREQARYEAEARGRALDEEIARAVRPDQYRRYLERQQERRRSVPAAPPLGQ